MLQSFTILTQNVGHKIKFVGTKQLEGNFSKGGGDLLSKSWDIISCDTPLKKTEEGTGLDSVSQSTKFLC